MEYLQIIMTIVTGLLLISNIILLVKYIKNEPDTSAIYIDDRKEKLENIERKINSLMRSNYRDYYDPESVYNWFSYEEKGQYVYYTVNVLDVETHYTPDVQNIFEADQKCTIYKTKEEAKAYVANLMASKTQEIIDEVNDEITN